jgi:adenylylsulfate kinase-like enzyme
LYDFPLTPIDAPYEPPANPEVELLTVTCTPEQAAEQVIAALRELGLLAR